MLKKEVKKENERTLCQHFFFLEKRKPVLKEKHGLRKVGTRKSKEKRSQC